MRWLPMLLAEGEPQGGGLEMFLRSPMFPLMAVVIVMFILMSRSGARQRREAADMLSKLKKNDKVTTSSGIIGVVVAIKEGEDEVTLRVDETTNSRLRVLKSSIARVVTEEQQAAAASPENKTS
jgi:preprotein translocase subunit YajC